VATTYSSSVISSTKLQAPAKSAFNFKQGANVVLHVPRRIEHRRAGREDVVRVVVERLEGILQRCLIARTTPRRRAHCPHGELRERLGIT
jgi:hypothetical protein